jgi:cysteine-rich repeat protein
MIRVVLALACAGCITEKLVPCGDVVCAPDATCSAGRCLDPAVIAACNGRPNGMACTTPGLSGVCSAGACTPPGCGNGFVDPGEVCDDGNTVGGDGCSADCTVRDTCPPLGTAPHYSVAIHLAVPQICDDYTIAGDAAFGLCVEADGITRAVSTGASDQPLVPIPGLAGTATTAIYHARVVPEGDTLYVESVETANFQTTILVYKLVAGAWVLRHPLMFPTAIDFSIVLGMPSRGPTRRIMVWMSSINELHEYQLDDNDVVTDLGRVMIPGLQIYNGLYLSEDGLRVIGNGTDGSAFVEFYSVRPTLDAPFGPPQPIPGVPGIAVPYMTPTCDRVYFDGFDSVYYVTQE